MTGSESTRAAVDVVVVGGGPAGSSAAVFLGRYGLDVLVFDRGNAALERCAYLENYLGFPGGVDVDAFHDLMHAHVAEAGARRVKERVDAVEALPKADADGEDADSESVDTDSDDARFHVETQAGTTVATREVVAAAWYDGSYLRPLDDDEMFAEREHHGECEERFDADYADDDGRTPVDGLYVASPAGARSAQAIVAAGSGAHVARALVEDRRRERGLRGEVALEYDWTRPASEFSGEWADRDRWREWFENELGDDHDLGDDELTELREAFVEEAFETRVDEAQAEALAARGLARFVDVVGIGRIVDAVGIDRFVDAVGIDRIVDAVGIDRFVDVVGIDRIVDAVGAERALDAIDDGTVREHGAETATPGEGE